MSKIDIRETLNKYINDTEAAMQDYRDETYTEISEISEELRMEKAKVVKLKSEHLDYVQKELLKLIDMHFAFKAFSNDLEVVAGIKTLIVDNINAVFIKIKEKKGYV